MYELIGAAVVTHVATSKAAETGGSWKIKEDKDPGVFNDYRSVGAMGLTVLGGVSSNRQVQAAALVGAVGLGFSYLSDHARGAWEEKGDVKAGANTPALGAPMSPGGRQVVGYTPNGQPIFGYAQSLPMQVIGQDGSGNPVYGAAPIPPQYGQAPQGAYGCAGGPVATMQYPMAPYIGADAAQGSPAWAAQANFSGQAPLASPFA